MEEEIHTSFGLLCAAVLSSAIADACGRPVALVRRMGVDWALANRRAPRTRTERRAAESARAWLLGAPGLVSAEEACEAVGVRRERVVAVVVGVAKPAAMLRKVA